MKVFENVLWTEYFELFDVLVCFYESDIFSFIQYYTPVFYML